MDRIADPLTILIKGFYEEELSPRTDVSKISARDFQRDRILNSLHGYFAICIPRTNFFQQALNYQPNLNISNVVQSVI